MEEKVFSYSVKSQHFEDINEALKFKALKNESINTFTPWGASLVIGWHVRGVGCERSPCPRVYSYYKGGTLSSPTSRVHMYNYMHTPTHTHTYVHTHH